MKCNTKQMKIGILTSGGDAPGMNAVIYYLKKYLSNNYEIIFFNNGYKGLVRNEIYSKDIDLSILTLSGSILGSSRYIDFKNNVNIAVNNLNELNIDCLIVIGGNGSFEGAKLLANNHKKIIFIPATIDNDVYFSEYSLGFSSALNEVHNNLIKLNSSFRTHNNICLVEVMGRNCPNISIQSYLSFDCMFSIGKNNKLNTSEIVKNISYCYSKNSYGIGIVAENTYSEDEIKNLLTRIKNSCKCDPKYIKLGYLQRGAFPDYIDVNYAHKFAYYTYKLIKNKKFNHAVYVIGKSINSSDINDVKKVSQINKIEEEIFEYDNN